MRYTEVPPPLPAFSSAPPPGALGGAKVPSVQSTLGYQHVALREPSVGEVYLLQNNHSILDMPMQKMYLHLYPRRRSSRTALDRTSPRGSLGWKGNSVRPWFLTGGRG